MSLYLNIVAEQTKKIKFWFSIDPSTLNLYVDHLFSSVNIENEDFKEESVLDTAKCLLKSTIWFLKKECNWREQNIHDIIRLLKGLHRDNMVKTKVEKDNVIQFTLISDNESFFDDDVYKYLMNGTCENEYYEDFLSRPPEIRRKAALLAVVIANGYSLIEK